MPAAPRKYDLLALDLDGTVFDSKGAISDANRRAILAARRAGMRVTICTGRGLVECLHALDQIEQTEPVVVAGGAIIACPITRRTQHRFAIDQALVAQVVQTILTHRHAALVLKDPLEAGYDYLVVTGEEDHPLDPVTEWWFATMKVNVRRVRRLDEDPDPEHTVRVGACGLSGVLDGIRLSISSACEGKAIIHNFPAVVAPEHASRAADGQKLHILELFDPKGNKWNAIQTLAAKWGIDSSRIAAVGDEVNDVIMIKGAGLGIAMGNAVPAVRDIADRHTRHHDEDGVAHAIDNILSGAW